MTRKSDRAPIPADQGIETWCMCGHEFLVSRDRRGSLSNCPSCGRRMEIPWIPENLFWIRLYLALVIVVSLTVFCTLWISGPAGPFVFCSGMAAIVLGWLLA